MSTESARKALILGAYLSPKKKHFSQMIMKFQELDFDEDLNITEKYWTEITENYKKELEFFTSEEEDLISYLANFVEKIEYFLTGVSLTGFEISEPPSEEEDEEEDSIEKLLEFKDFNSFALILEDLAVDIDDYLHDENPSLEEGHEIKEFIFQIFQKFAQLV